MNGRKEQRRVMHEREGQLLAAIRDAVAVRLRTTEDGHEVWQRGPVSIVVPVIPAEYPEPVQTALTVHRMAALTTDCPRCDNEVRVTETGGYLVRHQSVCPGDPDRLVELAREHGVEIVRRG